MKTMNGWRRGGLWGGDGSFGPSTFLSGPSLSQAASAPEDQSARGKAAIAKWNSLITRVSNIKDDEARGKLLAWMGRSDTPGSNTERYNAVLSDVNAGQAADPAIALRRVEQLEGAVSELSGLVDSAEKMYGTLTNVAPPSDVATPAQGLTLKGAALGLVAVLGLIVIPLWIKD